MLVKRDAVLDASWITAAPRCSAGCTEFRCRRSMWRRSSRGARKLRRKTAPSAERLRDEAIGQFMIRRWQEAVSTMSLRANVRRSSPTSTAISCSFSRPTSHLLAAAPAPTSSAKWKKRSMASREPEGRRTEVRIHEKPRDRRAKTMGEAVLGRRRWAQARSPWRRTPSSGPMLCDRRSRSCPGLLLRSATRP